ncbi:MAG: hypothetical protein CM15mP18_2020 [Methanobacteriota archaeon]|nr:MAG: hypothetical protein CM15mP18_2020 [Euryarchaeota archaeon]
MRRASGAELRTDDHDACALCEVRLDGGPNEEGASKVHGHGAVEMSNVQLTRGNPVVTPVVQHQASTVRAIQGWLASKATSSSAAQSIFTASASPPASRIASTTNSAGREEVV